MWPYIRKFLWGVWAVVAAYLVLAESDSNSDSGDSSADGSSGSGDGSSGDNSTSELSGTDEHQRNTGSDGLSFYFSADSHLSDSGGERGRDARKQKPGAPGSTLDMSEDDLRNL